MNIEISKGEAWRGEIRPSQDTRYAQFEAMRFGYRAAFRLLQNYQKLYGCELLADFISRWCPPKEKGNHTQNYISIVAKRCNLKADSPVDTTDEYQMRKIVAAMSFVENGLEPNMDDIKAGWYLHKNPAI